MKRKVQDVRAVKESGGSKERIVLLDYVRALAIVHVFLYHYYIEWFGGSFLIEPAGVARNLERLTLFQDGGVLGFFKNMFSFLFVYGFFSVNVFLLLSGFVLTCSFYAGGEFKAFRRAYDWVSYYGKRLRRLLIPFYVSVLVGIGFLFLRNVLFPPLGGAPIFGILDMLKLLFVPFLFFDLELLQRFNGDYWFITLILQLYLLFPVFYWFLKRCGAWGFLALTAVVSVLFRFYAATFMESVPMGVLYPAENSYEFFSFFLPRLFEFAFGMVLGYWYMTRDQRGFDPTRKFLGWVPFLVGVVVTLAGFSFNMYSWGWAFSDAVTAIGLFLVFLNIGQVLARPKLFQKWLIFMSDSSYETYLLHHYFLNYFLLPLLVTFGLKGQEWVFWSVLPFFFVAVIFIGWAGRWLGGKVERLFPVRRK